MKKIRIITIFVLSFIFLTSTVISANNRAIARLLNKISSKKASVICLLGKADAFVFIALSKVEGG